MAPDGSIKIPPEALKEYGFTLCGKLVLIPESRRSRCFSVSSLEKLKDSVFSFLNEDSLSSNREGEAVFLRGKPFCGVKLNSLV